jgi:hypothetical protein
MVFEMLSLDSFAIKAGIEDFCCFDRVRERERRLILFFRCFLPMGSADWKKSKIQPLAAACHRKRNEKDICSQSDQPLNTPIKEGSPSDTRTFDHYLCWKYDSGVLVHHQPL